MKTKNYSVKIEADINKVWDALWKPFNYGRWTSVFCEGSRIVGDLHQGNVIRFLGDEENGMYSKVEIFEAPYKAYFTHLGEIKEGQEKESEISGAIENYTLSEQANQTNLEVEMTLSEEHEAYMTETFEKALEIVKKIAETP